MKDWKNFFEHLCTHSMDETCLSSSIMDKIEKWLDEKLKMMMMMVYYG